MCSDPDSRWSVLLLPDFACSKLTLISDFPETSRNSLIETLQNLGFQTHLTTLGGPGLGIVSTITSGSDSDKIRTPEEGEGMVVPKRAGLRDAGVDGLARWADSMGGWCYT